jgi:hypothetical protein
VRGAKAKAMRRLVYKSRKSRLAELEQQVEELRLAIASLAKAVQRAHTQSARTGSVLDEILAVLEDRPSVWQDVIVPQWLVEALLKD